MTRTGPARKRMSTTSYLSDPAYIQRKAEEEERARLEREKALPETIEDLINEEEENDAGEAREDEPE